MACRAMQLIEQSIDKQMGEHSLATPVAQAPAATGHNIISADEKKQRVQHNIILAEYFKQKAKDPHGLLEKLIEQHENHVSGDTVVSPAPTFVPKPNKQPDSEGINLLVNALSQGQSPKGAQGLQPSSFTSASGQVPNYPTMQGSVSDINSILVYNIAAMSYQT